MTIFVDFESTIEYVRDIGNIEMELFSTVVCRFAYSSTAVSRVSWI